MVMFIGSVFREILYAVKAIIEPTNSKNNQAIQADDDGGEKCSPIMAATAKKAIPANKL